MPCENLKLGVHLARASQDCRRREDPINTLDTFAGCLHFFYQCPGLAFLWKLLHTIAGEAILLPHVIVRAVSHPWTTRGMRVCYSRCSSESFVLTISLSLHNQHIAQIILLHPSVESKTRPLELLKCGFTNYIWPLCRRAVDRILFWEGRSGPLASER